jgi:DNA-binding NtrC family response regulator
MTDMASDALPMTVLIVDDDPDHAFIARHVLLGLAPELEVRVLTALEGLAIELSAAPAGSLVLLDRLLAGVETYGALAETRAARPDLQVALLSAWLTPEEESRAMSAGATATAEKPSTLDGWRVLLRGLLVATQGRAEGPA